MAENAPTILAKISHGGDGDLLARKVSPLFGPRERQNQHENFIKHILKPTILQDLKGLYPDDWKKVYFHMDSAPAHIAAKTQKWLEMQQIEVIPKQEMDG